MYCNNCGRKGHVFRDCPDDVLSCGVIVFRDGRLPDHAPRGVTPAECLEVLMIQRKHSIGYVEFLRGKYSLSSDPSAETYVADLWRSMSTAEHAQLLSRPFDELWEELWNHDHSRDRSDEKAASRAKLLQLDLAAKAKEWGGGWATPEWGFPKGRRMARETTFGCALRELKEEANVDLSQLFVLRNVGQLEERFQGSNGVWYKHVYFLAVPKTRVEASIRSYDQTCEIGDIRWVSLEEARRLTRPHHGSRLQVLEDLANVAGSTFITYVEERERPVPPPPSRNTTPDDSPILVTPSSSWGTTAAAPRASRSVCLAPVQPSPLAPAAGPRGPILVPLVSK